MDQDKEKCKRCKKEFASKLYLQQHLVTHAAEIAREKPYFRDVCNKKSTQKSEVEYHRFTHGRKSTMVTLPQTVHSEVSQSPQVAQGICKEASVDEMILQMRDDINKKFDCLQMTQGRFREMSAIQYLNFQVDHFKSVAVCAQKSADIAILMASNYKTRAAAARKDVNDRKGNSLYYSSNILQDALNELNSGAEHLEKEAFRLQMDAEWKIEQASIARTNAETAACKNDINKEKARRDIS